MNPEFSFSAAAAAARREKPAWPFRVLLVEDDPDSRAQTAAILGDDAHRSFSVECAPNLVEAMTRLIQPGIDIVVLDLGMPELSGYKSFRAVEAAAGDDVPVVVLTSDDTTLSRELTLGLGAAAYLLKQEVSPFQLRRALFRALSH
jgi:DNA-binding response OmpR family regulator